MNWALSHFLGADNVVTPRVKPSTGIHRQPGSVSRAVNYAVLTLLPNSRMLIVINTRHPKLGQ